MYIVVRATDSRDDEDDDVKGRVYSFHKVNLKPQGGELEVEQNCLPELLTRMEPGVMLRVGTNLCILSGPSGPQQNHDDHTHACVVDLESKNYEWKDFQLPILSPGSTPRVAALDGRIYCFEYADGLEPRPLCGEFWELIRFPSEFPKCPLLLVSDPRHDRILMNLSSERILYAYYPHDRSFKLLGSNVRPWSEVLALVDEVVYVYKPGSACSLGLSAFDLSDGAKSLVVLWTSTVILPSQDGVPNGVVFLRKYVYKALFHVGNNTFWFAHWSPDNQGNVNMCFVKFSVYRIGDKIICNPVAFLTRRLESILRVFDVVLPEVMVSTLPHVDDGMVAPVPLSLDRTVEIESIVDLIDHLLAMEATWHEGKSLEDTLHSCIYLQRLDSLKDYSLLYPILRLSAASYAFAASDEEKISLGSCSIEKEVEIKLQSLEVYLSAKKANCGDQYMKALYETCLQRVKFRKFLYFALRRLLDPIGQGEVIKGYLENSLEALLQFSSRIIESCEAVGFTKCTVEVVTWTQTVCHFEKLLLDLKNIFSYPILGDLNGAIRIAVDIHNHKPMGAALKHLLNMIVQDGKLYGRVSMLSAVLSTCCQLENVENHPLVKTTNFKEVGKLVLDMLKVLCEDLKTQRDSLLNITYDWGKLEVELSAQKLEANTKVEEDIIYDVGYFVVVQATWSILRILTLGFETNLYGPRDYKTIYLCIIKCQQKLHMYMKEDEAKYFECCLNLSQGLLEVMCYLRDQEEKDGEVMLCGNSKGPVEVSDNLRKHKRAGESNEKRFRHLVKTGFTFAEINKEITQKRITMSDLRGSVYFKNAFRLAEELEDGIMCAEATKLKMVAKKNRISVKAIAKLQGRSLPDFKFQFLDHPVYAKITVD